MILTDNTCSFYDYLTYNFKQEIFVNESFTMDCFKTNKQDKNVISDMISLIGEMIEHLTLKSLMYENNNKYRGMNIEAIHIPESFQFKNDLDI